MVCLRGNGVFLSKKAASAIKDNTITGVWGERNGENCGKGENDRKRWGEGRTGKDGERGRITGKDGERGRTGNKG